MKISHAIKNKGRGWKQLVLALFLGVALSGAAWAGPFPELDMNMDATHPAAASIKYDGGVAPLIGTSISVDTILGIDTPLNAGFVNQVNCLSCLLAFTTGNLTGSDESSWFFGGGGTITVIGGVDLDDSGGITAGDVALGTTLLTGSFISAEVIAIGGDFKVTIAAFTDTKDPGLTGFYGVGSGGWSGNLNLSFRAGGSPPLAFATAEGGVRSGDIVNIVPEPASLFLLGSGLVGFAGFARRKLRKS